ncbi:MAG: PqqD family peptide modification chaperone [Bacteroidales bacterium]|nr:PqqD family peptide modification chaperone [Bacteroidales bacterium]
MKLKNTYILRTICGQHVLSAEGAAAVNMSSLITLNDTAAYLWESVQGKEFDADALAALLLDKYEVQEDVAKKDAAAIAAKWLELGVAE